MIESSRMNRKTQIVIALVTGVALLPLIVHAERRPRSGRLKWKVHFGAKAYPIVKDGVVYAASASG
jgi:hypothetical protein